MASPGIENPRLETASVLQTQMPLVARASVPAKLFGRHGGLPHAFPSVRTLGRRPSIRRVRSVPVKGLGVGIVSELPNALYRVLEGRLGERICRRRYEKESDLRP